MSSQVEVITPQTSIASRPSLFEGVAGTSSVAIIIGLGFVAIYIFNRGIVPSVLVLTSAAGMGLTTGLISRVALPLRNTIVRWLVALFSLCIGMIPMGWLSKGYLGFDLITGEAIEPDWQGLLRLALGAVTAWLAVRAWARKPTPQTSPIAHKRTGSVSLPRFLRLRSRMSSEVEARPTLNPISANHRPTSTPSHGRAGSSRRNFFLGRPRLAGNHPMKPAIKGIRQRGRINSPIRLAESVQHRCPFCLELVERSDPRGIMECSICHTLHHADCWAVTETCQVPHHSI